MIRIIAAIDNKRGLAKDGQIPWNLPKDVARFRKLTQSYGANVLMGRKTYELMGSQLKKRTDYIVSSSQIELPEGCTLVKDLDSFLENFNRDIWIIGGAEIYRSSLKYADELYLTNIDADFNCDKFFPDYSDYKIKDIDGPYTENGLNFSYQLLMRF